MVIQHTHTYGAMCASRCGVVATVEDGIFTRVTADPEHPNECLCVKGSAAPEMVYSPDPGWLRIAWDEALALTASRLANAFGSPNILYPDHLCGWHKKGSAQYTYGLSMPQPDYEHTRCMLLWGYNPQASRSAEAM
jgi:anaerobic selenocysteine-containing dehydrogenase